MPSDRHFSTAKINTFKKNHFQKMPKLLLFLFCKYFSNNPLGFMVQIFHKNAPGLEGHVPPLKFWNLGQVNLNSFEFQNRAKYEIDSKLNIFRNFQIHFSNHLYLKKSCHLLSLIWIGWNWNQKQGKVMLFPLIQKFQKVSNLNHSIQSHNQTIIIQLLI